MIIIVLIPLALFADSYTFSTSIDGVNNGLNGIGLSLFPLGTSFTFYKYVPVLKDNPEQMRFNISMDFSFSDNWIPDGFTYTDGTPYWSMTVNERFGEYASSFVGGRYFNPRSNIYMYVQQGFGTNPVAKGGPLVYVRAAWNTRYSLALEADPFIPGTGYLNFVNPDGTQKEPFGLTSKFTTMPWLQGNRKYLTNYLELSTYWNLNKWTGTDAYDGLYGQLTLEYGPSWLANTITPKGINSDYWKAYTYLEEKLTLFSVKQDDGKNWATLHVGHSNSLSYVGGDIVPDNKLPPDRLHHSASDSIWLHFAGPQFIASDCYTFIELRLTNNVYWGSVVNETSQKTRAVELQSDLSGIFHLRLFGFIRFDYSFGYVFNRGIYGSDQYTLTHSNSTPYWWQSAELRFYVAV